MKWLNSMRPSKTVIGVAIIYSLLMLSLFPLNKAFKENNSNTKKPSKLEAEYSQLKEDIPGLYTEMLDTPFIIKNEKQEDSIIKEITNYQRKHSSARLPIIYEGSVRDRTPKTLIGYIHHNSLEGSGFTGNLY